jgi:capsular exopolysaccharide synthesis family protein
MELRDYLEILSRRKWVIFLTLFFTLSTIIVGIILIPPKYTATTKIRVLTPRTGSADYVDYNINYSNRLIGTYIEVANSTPVLEELSKYVSPMPESIQVEAVADTELIQIDVVDQDPALAQHAANKLAQILITQTRELYSNEVNPVNIYVVDPATFPEKPSSPSPWLVITLGVAASLIGGIGLAFLYENLDTRLYTTKEIEDVSGLTVIGDIPDGSSNKGLLIGKSRVYAEAFRRLGTNILSLERDDKLATILITSSVAQDGRTTIVANLATIMAQANLKVIILDADFRWSNLHTIFDLKNEYGLSDILKQKAELLDTIQESKIPGVDIITSGSYLSEAVEFLRTQYMDEILNHLKKIYDIVLIDSPASVTVTDPAVLAAKVDGVILVVRHGWVRKEAFLSTLRHMRGVKANIIGIVSNRTGLGTSSKFAKMQPEERLTQVAKRAKT